MTIRTAKGFVANDEEAVRVVWVDDMFLQRAWAVLVAILCYPSMTTIICPRRKDRRINP